MPSALCSPQSLRTRGRVILYRNKMEVRLEQDTVWLTQKQTAGLFEKDVRTVNEHIKNVFNEGELLAEAVVRKFRITASDGKRIAAALFVCFLQKNGILLGKDGSKRIDDNALVALTLMIAASRPSEKEIMIKVILNLLNKKAK